MPRYFLLVVLCVGFCRAHDEPAPACSGNTVSPILQSAREALGRRAYNAAIQQFRNAETACPRQRAIQLELANAYFMAQRLNEAKETAAQVLRMEPGDPAALEVEGNVAYLQGDGRAAINTFIDLLERHPQNQEAPYMLGRIYYQEGLIDQAIGQFERLLKLNVNAFKAYDNLALCYEAKGDNEKALRYFLTAIKLSEQNSGGYDSAYADLAELLLKSGDSEKAFGAASRAADRNPYSARNFYLGGKALDQLGRTDLCLNWLQRSAALDPSYPESQYLLARVYRRLGQSAKAEEAQRRFSDLKAKKRPPLPQ